MCPIKDEDNNMTREQLLEALKDATDRLDKAKALRKADLKVHKENISGIEAEIKAVMHRLND